MRIYSIRTTSNRWKIFIYNKHICTELCKKLIEFYDSNIYNKLYNNQTNLCIFNNRVQKSYVNLHTFDKKNQLYGDQIIIPNTNINIYISFSIKEPCKISIQTKNQYGFTLNEIISKIKYIYKWMYKEEEKTASEQDFFIISKCICTNDNKSKLNTVTEIVPYSEECPICLDTFKNNEICITNCGHFFHKKCINIWLENNNSCPVCRAIVILCNLCNNSKEIVKIEKFKIIPIEYGINRNETDGIFGIHSNYFEDLCLIDMIYDRLKKTLYPNIKSC